MKRTDGTTRQGLRDLSALKPRPFRLDVETHLVETK